MALPKSYKDLTAPDLVKEWKKLVNNNVMIGRDSHLIKQALVSIAPVQILLGMYYYYGNKTISIPMFLRAESQWLVIDEVEAEIELACKISHSHPPEYWIWRDAYEEVQDRNTTFDIFQQALTAKKSLKEWSDKVLS